MKAVYKLLSVFVVVLPACFYPCKISATSKVFFAQNVLQNHKEKGIAIPIDQLTEQGCAGMRANERNTIASQGVDTSFGNWDAHLTVDQAERFPADIGTVTAHYMVSGAIQVNWQAWSVNNDHFDVELSADGRHFFRVGTVKMPAANHVPGKVPVCEFISPLYRGIAGIGLLVLFSGMGFTR